MLMRATAGVRRAAVRRAVQRANVTTGPNAEWNTYEEDEHGRPRVCLPGLGEAELKTEPAYWISDIEGRRANSRTDVPGRQALQQNKEADQPYFNMNPDVEGLQLDVNLANQVPLHNVNQDEIVVPVFNLEKEQVGTRKLDSYIFGKAPEADVLSQMWHWELAKRKGFGGQQVLHHRYVPGPAGQLKSKKNAPLQVAGGRRESNHKRVRSIGGGAETKTSDHRDMRFDVSPEHQSRFLRQALTVKLQKERLIVVEDFNFPTNSVDVLRDWTNSWGFDRDRTMAYIVDGGSASMPSVEMNPEVYWANLFVYGIQVQNIRSLNGLDILRHRYLVVTEGVLTQLEDFFRDEKAARLPPHMHKKMTVPLAELGEKEFDWASIEAEAAYETSEAELPQFNNSRTLDDPWLNGRRWDANEERIKVSRRSISDQLPRLGSSINTDIRKYWESKGVRLPPHEDEGREYMLPPQKGTW
eukprot:Rhum_TRINITY_DN21051_c0_g1::Rhum_TRINITY_DN21051_c0_g1_i1::g.173027::m.173027/K02926/RP-L4, MRPL4, rplD; large subunit ribosomal protein L4